MTPSQKRYAFNLLCAIAMCDELLEMYDAASSNRKR